MVALHSTMFLLILQIAANIIGEHIVFTFHNVSINTERRIRKTKREVLFTFHNVSINTRSSFSILSLVPLFTFHNVSINTPTPLVDKLIISTLHSTMFLLIPFRLYSFQKTNQLYIPQCFY